MPVSISHRRVVAPCPGTCPRYSSRVSENKANENSPADPDVPASNSATSVMPVVDSAAEAEEVNAATRREAKPSVTAAGKDSLIVPGPAEGSAKSAGPAEGSAKDLAKARAALDQAERTKPVLPRVVQVLMAIFFPIVTLVLAIRLVTSSVFLWVEYHRPGFPADSFGFSTDDRMTYGSYTIDYLLNFTGPRYLGDLVNAQGNKLFLAREVAHMADVKTVITMAFLVGGILALLMLIGMIYLRRRSVGGIRRSLFAGSIATLVVVIGLGVFAALGWERFFTDFHEIFFANGTWTFYTDDTLIRLFPSDFWSDAGIFIGAFVLVVSSLVMAFTWPSKSRRKVGRH